MTAISSAMVKDLREKTGAGMLDCKKALEESGGDMEKAVDFLRKKGISTAAKKAGRITSEGTVAALLDGRAERGVLLEVNCETDFVARNPDFQAFVADSLKHILEKAPKVVRPEEGEGAFLDQPSGQVPGKTVGEVITGLIGKIGENISPRRFVRWELQGSGRLHSYIHMGGKLGVLVEVGCPAAAAEDDAVKLFAKQVSMQIAAANPLTVERGQVPAETLDRERDIYRTQVLNSGKPANIIEKIVEGKLAKFFKDNVLLEQEWVHDTALTVSKAMAEASKAAGCEITLRRFARFALGEGLQKHSNDLAAEVSAQLQGK